MKRALCLSLFLLVLLVQGSSLNCEWDCSAKEEMAWSLKRLGSLPIAEVNGERILFKDFLAELQKLGESEGVPVSNTKLKYYLLQQLIKEKILTAEILPYLDAPPSELPIHKRSSFKQVLSLLRNDAFALRWLEQEKKREALFAFLEQKLFSKVAVSQEEMKDYLRLHPMEVWKPTQVRARQILVLSRDQASKIYKSLKEGASFEEIAKKHSVSLDAKWAGDLGFFGKGELIPEFDTVFDLQPGSISHIVRSPFGYHILKVEEKRSPQKMPHASLEEIRKKILEQKRREIFHRWIRQVSSHYQIKINKRLLALVR